MTWQRLFENPLEKKFRFPEGLFTEKEWVQLYADRLEEAKVDWHDLINRQKWNRLGGGEQERYEEMLKKRAEKPVYRAWRGDSYFQPISKVTYLWAKKRLRF